MQKQTKARMTTKVLANCALLAALSVVLARLIVPMPNASTRFSIEAVPIFIAGMLFGPIPGALVGFTADFVGCLFSGYGYNPIFCVPPILYGLCAGLLRHYICARPKRQIDLDLVKWNVKVEGERTEEPFCQMPTESVISKKEGYFGVTPINKRKIGISILLYFVTFGIYKIYWDYLLVKNIRAIKKDESSCTGEMLCLVFVPFYSIYWWITRGKFVKNSFAEQGYSANSNEIVYLILAIFGLSIVSNAILQSDFNSLSTQSTQTIPKSPPSLLRLGLGWFLPVLFGSVLYQSATLAWVYGDGVFFESFVTFLSTRSVQFAITMVLDVLIVFLLCKTNIFKRMGLWPERKEKS